MSLDSLPAWVRGRFVARRTKSSQKKQRRAMFFEGLENRQLMAFDALDDSGATTENTVLTVAGAAAGVLANDTGGAFEVTAFQATSAQGAVVNVNPDGTYTYNPTAAPNLQKLGAGQSVVDTFSYTGRDNVFPTDGVMKVQLIHTTGTSPGTVTANWLNIWNALDGGAGPTGTVAGYTVANNLSDTETVFNYGGEEQNFSSTFGLNSINNNGPGGSGGFGSNAGDNSSSDYSIRTRTYLRFNTAGTYTIGMGSDDGRRISLAPAYAGSAPGYGGFTAQGDQFDGSATPAPGTTVIGFTGGTGHRWTVGTFTVAAGDKLLLDAFYYEQGGGDSGEIAIANGTFATFTNTTDFSLLAQGVKNIDLSSTGAFTADTATVSVTVSGVNEAPTANPNTYAASEDTVLNVAGYTETPKFNVLVYDGTDNLITSADAARGSSTNGAAVNAPNSTTVYTGTGDVADFGSNGDGSFPGQLAVPAPGGGDNYAVFITGYLKVDNSANPGNQWTFGLFADDASRIRIDLDQDGILEGNLGALGGGEGVAGGGGTVAFLSGCCANTRFAAVTIPDGIYKYEAVYTEGNGGDYGEFFYAPGNNPAFTTSAYSLIGSQLQGITSLASITNPGLLGNATDEEVDLKSATQSLSVARINGVVGLTGTSTLGAAITANTNGSFSYNPNIPGSLVQSLAAGQVANDTFTYTITDNDPVTPKFSTATVTVTVTGRNDNPDALNDTYTTNENTPFSTTDVDVAPRNGLGDLTPGVTTDDGVLVNDLDVDSTDTIQVVSAQGVNVSGALGTLNDGSVTVATALGGSVTVNDNGKFTYNPTGAAQLQKLGAGQSAVDSFAYQITDNVFVKDGLMKVQLLATTTTNPGTSTPNWLNVWNAIDGGATTGTIAGYNVTTNLSDTEVAYNYGDAANYGGTFGLNSINGNGPGGAGGFAGGDNYSIRTRTSLKFTTGGTFTLGMGSDDGRRISLTPAVPGSAPGYSGFTAQGGQVDGPFVAGQTVIGFNGGTGHQWSVGTFTVAAGDVLSLDAFYYEGAGGDSGEIALASGTFGSWTNTTDFTLLQDGVLGVQLSTLGIAVDTATVSITVNGINEAPIANPDTYVTSEDTALNIAAAGLLTNDTDEEVNNGSASQSLAVTRINGIAALTGTSTLGAIITANANGSFSYNPNVPGSLVQALSAGQIANDTFTYTITDNDPVSPKTSTATVTVTVVGINDLPTVNNNTYSTDEDTSFATTDVDLAPREGNGDLTPANTADDGVLVNDVEVDTNDVLQVYSAQGTVLSGAIGALGDGSVTVTSTLGASVTISDRGTFTYNPAVSTVLRALNPNETATDSFVYTATDGSFVQGFRVKVYQPTGAGDLAATDAFLAGARPNEKFNGIRSTVNFLNNGAAGQFNGAGTASPMDDETNTPGLAGGSQNDFIVEANGKITIPAAGNYTFSVNSDDGFGLTFSGGPGTVNLTAVNGDNDGTSTTGTVNPRLRRSTGRGSADTFGTFNFSAPGQYDVRLVNWQGAGGANVEFFGAPGAFASFAATNTWRLVGDTDNGGLQVNGDVINTFQATVTVSVQGVNDNPIAVNDNPSNAVVSENGVLTVPAVAGVPGLNVQVYVNGSIGSGAASAESYRAANAPTATSIVSLADLEDPQNGTGGSQHFFTTLPVQPTQPPGLTGGDDNNYAVYFTGTLQVLTAGTYTFGDNTDDASRIRIDGVDVVVQDGCCADKFGTPITLTAGFHTFLAFYTEGGGGSGGEFFYAPGSFSSFNSNFKLIGDGSGGILAFATPASGLLVNDSDDDHLDQISVDTATIISAWGATVTPAADGSFTYNPATSQTAQLLTGGQTLADSFVYILKDSFGGSSTATVAVTVTGVSDPVNDFYTVTETNPGAGISLNIAAPGVLTNDSLPKVLGTNIALGRPAAQSTDYQNNPANGAQNAVDGNFNNITHTADNASNSWWQVDLGPTTNVGEVLLFNRADCCGNRLSNFRVSLWNGDPNAGGSTEAWHKDYFQTGNVPQGGTFTVGANDVGSNGTTLVSNTGNFIRVQILGNNNAGDPFLSFREVQVYNAVTPAFQVQQAQGANIAGPATFTATGGGQVVLNPNGGFTYDQLGVFDGLDTGETGAASFTYNVINTVTTGAATTTSQSSAAVYPVSSTDLLQGLSATVTGTALNADEGTSRDPITLTDGAFGTNAPPLDSTNLTIRDNTTFTYSLDTVAYPAGFAISSIDVFSGWQDTGRTNQNYTVRYSTVVDPNTFVDLTTVAYAATDKNTKVSIGAGSQFILTNVAQLQFVFGAQQNGYVGYREIDVNGFGLVSTVTAAITVNGQNDAPVTGGPASVAGTEDDAVINGSVPAATDVDIEPLTYHTVGVVPAGVTFNANGTFSVTPLAADQGLDNGESRVVLFQYAANDGTVDSATATVTVTINGVNDAPVTGGAASAVGTEDDASINGSVPAATDIDIEPLTYHVVGATPAGVTFNANGTFSVTPLAADQGLDTGESRVITFTYAANDGTIDSAAATVTVTINGVNDAPVAAAGGPYTINAGENLALNASATFDVDIEPLTYKWDFDQNGTTDLTTSSPLATVTWNTLQSLTIPFGPGAHTINLTVNDGTVDSALTTAIVNVTNNFVFTPVQDGFDDGYTLILNPEMDRIEVRDTPTGTLLTSTPRAGVNQVVFTGTADDDTLTVDFTYTNPIPATSGVQFNGLGQIDGDKLVIQNGTATTVTHNFVTENNGSVDIDGRLITYTGLEPITDNLSATNRVFNFTSALAEAITLRNSVAPGFDLFLNSNVGGEQIDFVKPTASLTVNLSGGGVDTVDWQTSAFTGNVSLVGTGADDLVNVTGAASLTGATAAVSITGVQAINFTGGSLAATTTVTLTSSGGITTNSAATDVAALSLIASAATGIDLDTNVTNLTATTSGAGNITLDEVNGANVLNVVATNGDATVTSATGALNVTTVSATNVTLTTTAGAITDANVGAVNVTATLLNATGATGVDLDTTVTQLTAASTNAAIVIRETNGLAVNTVNAGTGDVTLTLAAGAITDNNLAGVLNVTAGLLNATSIGAIDLDTNVTSLTAATTNAAIVIREVDAISVNTLTAGSAMVSLAAGGAITDGNAALNNVTAASLLLTAVGGIALETTVGQLAASNSTSGAIVLTNSGALNLTTLSELSIGSFSGVSSAGAVTVSVADTAAATDTLMVSSPVTSTGGSVTLNAGDNATINANLNATTTVAINFGADAVDSAGGVLTVATPVVITGTGATFTGGNQADSFSFRPQASTPISVFGNQPVVNPGGDTLALDVTGATNPTLNILAGQGSGLYTFTNRASVQYASIENSTTSTPINVALDATATGIENIRLQRSSEAAIGAQFEVYNSNTSALLYAGDITQVLSFLFSGSANDNTVMIDDINGLVDLAGTVPAGAVGDNGNVSGTPEIFLRGAGGTDAIVFANRTDATDQTYGLGTGAGPGAQAGEIRTTNGPRVLSVYFDGIEGVVSNDISTPDTGTLTITGDANANVISLASSAGGTTISPLGYVPFTFAPRAFNAVIVNAGDGDDSLTLSSLNAGESTLALTLNGEIGNDTLTVETATLGNTLALQGGVGNDAYQLGGALMTVDGILAPITIADTSGVDSLTLVDSADGSGDTVTITDSTITGVNGSSAPNVSFSAIEALDVTTSGAADTITTTLNGTNGLVSVNVRGNGGDDRFFLNTADNMTTLTTVNLIGDAGSDDFGSVLTPIRPLAGTTTNVALYGDTTAVTTNPGGAVTDHLFLDMTTTSAGLTVDPLVIVDTVTGQASAANTRVLRFGGIDDIDLTDGGVLTDVAIGDLYLRATEGADSLLFYRENAGVMVKRNGVLVNPIAYSPTNRIVAYGRGGNDYMEFNFTLGGAISADFRGGTGDDTIQGGFGNDLLVGGGGNDQLKGGEGNDVLFGEDQLLTTSPIAFDVQRATGVVQAGTIAGNDVLDGGGGNDTLFGGGGNDDLTGGPGNDYIHGGDGDDILNSNGGDDILRGEAGNDVMNGGEGQQILLGGGGDDQIYGRGGRDFMLGGLGADTLYDDDAANDVLVSGGLAYDTDNSFAQPGASLTGLNDNDLALQALMFTGANAWNGTGLFTDRVTNVASLTAMTNDTVVDVLVSSTAEQDYVISNTADLRLNTDGDTLLTI